MDITRAISVDYQLMVVNDIIPVMSRKVNITTQQAKQVIDLTDQLDRLLADEAGTDQARQGSGVLFLQALHTTVALTLADLDPGAEKDMLEAFYEMVPKLNFRHPHDPEHMPDHILSALIGPELSLPVEQGRLVLGTWQRVVFLEFNGPQERQLMFNFLAF